MSIKDKQFLFIGVGGVSDAVRLVLPASELSKHVDKKPVFTRLTPNTDLEKLPDADIVVLCRVPSPELVDYFKKKGAKVVFDQDDNFSLIPETHPGYKGVGRGNPEYLKQLYTAMNMADAVTVTNSMLANSLLKDCTNWKNMHIVPNGWSKAWFTYVNPFARKNNMVTLGWGGTITHREDFQLAIPGLKSITKKNPNVRVAIIGDPKIYEFLSAIPEEQKLFVPMVPFEMYPYTLSCFDVMLAPLLDLPFNHVKSDIKLVDAGAMGIPWIASDVAPYREWSGHGGFICRTVEEWTSAIGVMIKVADDYRSSLGDKAAEYARNKEMGVLINQWIEVFESL